MQHLHDVAGYLHTCVLCTRFIELKN